MAMNALYIECGSGVSGSALVGALLDMSDDPGILLHDLRDQVRADFDFYYYKTMIGNITATQVILAGAAKQSFVLAADFLKERLTCRDEDIRTKVTMVIMKYLEAWSRLSGIAIEEIRLDEERLLQLIILSAGYFILLSRMSECKILSSPLPVPFGQTRETDRESPLIMELAIGAKVTNTGETQLRTSPLGVALLSASVNNYCGLPEMLLKKTGYGAITKENNPVGTLRMAFGEIEPEYQLDTNKNEDILVVETNIDDMNPEFFPCLTENILAAGALDTFLTPVYMKKGRPGMLLTALCKKNALEDILTTIFKESTTLGVRIREERRRVLKRDFIQVDTPYGMINVKSGYIGQSLKPTQISPEFEDCKKAALEHGLPLKDVYIAAQLAAYRKLNTF